MYTSILVLCMVMLLGCQASPGTTTRQSNRPAPQIPPEPPLPTVKVEDSQFEPAAKFTGIAVTYGGMGENAYFLRSWVHKTTGHVQHQLYVADSYEGSWALWNAANSQTAQSLEFIPISRKVVSCGAYSRCSYAEDFAVTIPDAMLREHQDGLAVKFYAKSGREMVLKLTARQIRRQLMAIDGFLAARNLQRSEHITGSQQLVDLPYRLD
jgi:hypothetical protein